METHTFFLVLFAVLISARLVAEFAVKLRVPAVVGEIVAGIVLGPSLLGWIEPVESLRLLAEIGIILLLFQVGLESDFMRLAKAGYQAVAVASIGVAAPLGLGFVVAHYGFSLSVLVSLFVGGTLTATSIGVTIRVLSGLGLRHGAVAQVVLGAAVIDDVIGVILIAILYEFSVNGGFSWMNFGNVVLSITAFIIVTPVASKVFTLIVQQLEPMSEMPGLVPVSTVVLVLFFAWLAHTIGAPELLGGFAAGLALSRRFLRPLGAALHENPGFTERVERETRPFVQLFTPIFFVVIGLSLELHRIEWGSPDIWIFALTFLAIAVVTKLVSGLAMSGSWKSRFAVGLAMIPRAEVGLVFAKLGAESGVFDATIYAALVIVIVATTLLPPIVLSRTAT